jgi:hypothetical protein
MHERGMADDELTADEGEADRAGRFERRPEQPPAENRRP